MVDPEVRWADLDDAREVAIVHVDSWKAAYSGLIDQRVLDALDVDQRARSWSRWIASSISGQPTDDPLSEPHRMLVAESDGQVVGWATFGPGRDQGRSQVGELAGLYVHPDHWSARIGHALITRVERELRSGGWTEAYLWVLRGNDRAIRFYERHGWAADGVDKIVEAGGAANLPETRHVRRLG
ncbi:GNAT family N-acetyltransferase [Lacisediminihabitans profunda]|uniref:GNAT family N-acetyltransferase n=1 Tax=Lacisediminihabitans profunda TaxID=2594790 RepID=A0A5C8UXH0_9MICO|nr:GNAT family N-acetyltransferase [Lacisediminihabitans profunda]TXN32409.1 GNAT family N-acetyltransferase [Lacisediminihabitans profunda]